MRPQLKTFLIALVTAALVVWFFRQANLGDVWREIRAAEPWPLALAFVMTSITYVLRALRWQYLLQPIGTTHFRVAFRTTVIGFAANAVLPARVGEVLRPYLLARREGLALTATFATIILERLLDLVTVLLFFGAFVLFFDPGMAAVNPAIYRTVKAGGLVGAAGSLLALVMVAVLARQADSFGRTVDRATAVLPARLAGPLTRMAHTFVQGLAVTRSPRHLAGCVLLSVPLWLSIAAGVWFCMQAFHMTIPYTGSFLVLALLVVGVSVPTPGAVGGFHEAFRIGVTAFYGVDNDRAVGAAIVLHAISFIPVSLLGAWFMFRDGLDLAGVRRVSEEARGLDEGAAVDAGGPPRSPGSGTPPIDERGSLPHPPPEARRESAS
jgi:glycosyltransferase 2 family protein